MDRFVAMLWDPDAGDRVACTVRELSRLLKQASPRWTTAAQGPGLSVLTMAPSFGDRAVAAFPDGDGLIIGQTFARGDEAAGPVSSVPPEEAMRIRDTAGSHLIDRYWGNYLAIWRSDRSGDCVVLRDPCGAVPCFRMRIRGVDLFFSWIEDVCRFPGFVFEPDWAFIQAFLLYNYFPTRFTGVAGVEEVQPGQRLVRRRGGICELTWAWDASAIARQRETWDFSEARDLVFDTASRCFAGWGRAYRRPLVRLSGGLDSSTVVSMLRACSDADVSALHLTSSANDNAELHFARIAAEHAGVALIEVESSPHTHVLSGVIDLPRTARPTKQILGLSADGLVAAACDTIGADCTMAGHGGDALFIQRSAAGHTLDDFVRERGVGPGFLRVAYHTSLLLEQSIWRIGADALRSPFQARPQPYSFLRDREWLSNRPVRREAIANLPREYVSHPWLEDAMALPPGKALQLENIMGLRNYHGTVGSSVSWDAVLPFFCQPLVELCLRTPTWLFGEGGSDRALERAAFSPVLPDDVVRRTGKGLINSALLDMIAYNLPFLRELALDGEMISQDWIDGGRIEAALTRERLASGTDLEDTLNIIVVEAWLSSWRKLAREAGDISRV